MQRTAIERLTLRVIGIAGVALFGFFFALTWHTPQWVEEFAAGYIEGRVADHVDETIEDLGPPRGQDALSRYAAKLYAQNEERIAELKALLKADARAQLSACLEQIRAMTPQMRARLQAWVEEGAQLNIGSLQVENAKLVGIIQSGYLKVVDDLKHEIRGFTAINAIAFLLLLLASFLKPAYVRELLIPGLLLALSTLICAYLYVVDQDWLLAMIHGNYVGKIYGAYLGLVFLFLCDIVLNRGRIARVVLRGIVGA